MPNQEMYYILVCVCVCERMYMCVCVWQRVPFAANNRPESNQWFHRDVDAMSHQLNTAPVFIDADASTA